MAVRAGPTVSISVGVMGAGIVVGVSGASVGAIGPSAALTSGWVKMLNCSRRCNQSAWAGVDGSVIATSTASAISEPEANDAIFE